MNNTYGEQMDEPSRNKPGKNYFLLKLIGPRPTFPQDMTDEERKLMLAHIAAWKDPIDRGIVVVFGPVLDPKGAWGVGIVEVDGEDEVRALIANDPVIKSGLGFRYEYYPMPNPIVRK